MRPIETDPETGVEIFQLTESACDSDNIYGEHPFSDPEGARIAVRHKHAKRQASLSIVDLESGASFPVADHAVAAWQAWGQRLYYRQAPAGPRHRLETIDYRSLERVGFDLPVSADTQLSSGTVSSDGRFYACIERSRHDGSRVRWFDLHSGESAIVVEKEDCLFKHEQFSLENPSRDRHLLMVQANLGRGDTRDCKLGILEVPGDGNIHWLAASDPHTLRCSGHECWIKGSDRVLFSVMYDEASWGNLWTAGLHDPSPRIVCRNHTYFGHVTSSHCGAYWLADGYHEPATPVYAGLLSGEKYRRVFNSWTMFRGAGQLGHTHLYLTADRRHVIFSSSRTGTSQVYAARVPDTFWQSLASEGALNERPAPPWSADRTGNRWTQIADDAPLG